MLCFVRREARNIRTPFVSEIKINSLKLTSSINFSWYDKIFLFTNVINSKILQPIINIDSISYIGKKKRKKKIKIKSEYESIDARASIFVSL